MMGGSGGGRFSGPLTESLERQIERARQQEQDRLEREINSFLHRLLVHYNDRNTDLISERVSQVQRLLGEAAEVKSIIFGGSIAKHTDVSGLSDVDALVILRRTDLTGKPPQALLDAFYQILRTKLPRAEVASINKGRLAVTVKYLDDLEIQLLPALRSGTTISIAEADGKGWNETKPLQFQTALKDADVRLNGNLVPAIKLVKSLVDDLPELKQLSGYHIEALALDAMQGYNGPTTPRALLLHILERAAERILTPLKDITGQSQELDAYLGPANSLRRRNTAQALVGMRRRLAAATTLSQWKAAFEAS
jgi:hypothetical protein